MKIITRNSPPETRLPRRRSGFTLIELLLVLVILGVLAAIVVPKFAGRTEQAREAAAKTQLSTFGTVLDAFEVDNGYYPKGKSGLNDLVAAPRDAKNWQIVVARLGEEVTVKRFRKTASHIELLPENPDYNIIVVQPEEPFDIEGLAVGLIRNTLLM